MLFLPFVLSVLFGSDLLMCLLLFRMANNKVVFCKPFWRVYSAGDLCKMFSNISEKRAQNILHMVVITFQTWTNFFVDNSYLDPILLLLTTLSCSCSQERVIENLREQKEREDRVRLEEMEQMRKENQELKDKLAALQNQKLSQSVPTALSLTQSQRPDGEVSLRFSYRIVECNVSTFQGWIPLTKSLYFYLVSLNLTKRI